MDYSTDARNRRAQAYINKKQFQKTLKLRYRCISAVCISIGLVLLVML